MYLREYEPAPASSLQYAPSGVGMLGESGQLRHFRPSELVLSPEEARAVLIFFWPNKEGELRSLPITDQDREFAQALLVEAIDASYPMGIMEQVYRRFFLRVPSSFNSIARSVLNVARVALQNQWLRRTQSITSERLKIYESVRVTLARNFRTVLELRLQTGDLTY